MPLTPLYRQGTLLTLLYRKKTYNTKNLYFSLHEEWETHGQSFFDKGFTRLLEHISSKVWKNFRGLESGPERGGIGSVIELAMATQVYKKVDHFTTWLVGVLQKFWQFQPEGLSKKIKFISTWLQDPSSVVFPGVLWFLCFVL